MFLLVLGVALIFLSLLLENTLSYGFDLSHDIEQT